MNNTTFTDSSDDKVRAIAYSLWLEEGQPEGRAEHHWHKALELVNTEASPVGKPVTAKKASPAAKPADKAKAKAPAAAASRKASPRKRG